MTTSNLDSSFIFNYDYKKVGSDLFLATPNQKQEELSLELVEQRYTNVPCVQATALAPINNKYLHANWVQIQQQRRFIVTQAPFNQTTSDLFWEVIERERVKLILDLTNKSDDTRFNHYPTVASATPSLVQTQDEGSLVLSTYQLSNKEQVTRINCTEWKDQKDLPITTLNLLIDKINAFSGAIMVHCLAGLGRSGTVVTAHTLSNLVLQGKIQRDNVFSMVKTCVTEGRVQRGQNFVQTLPQFALLAQCVYSLVSNYPTLE